jgi:hypothetical protein
MTEEIIINYNVLNPTGFLHCKIPQDIFSAVEREVNDLISSNFVSASKYNNYLAGSIEKEYNLFNCIEPLNKFFKQIVPKYWEFNNNPDNAKKLYQIDKSCKQSSLWVNLQKKYEYNPLHNHGGELSFVLYINIPYNIEDEIRMPHVINSNSVFPPQFSFVYPAFPPEPAPMVRNLSLVKRFNIPVSKGSEGLLLLFPAWLQHEVTPFYTSDDYRISVSGNLVPIDNNG